jgi:hypothetical protein
MKKSAAPKCLEIDEYEAEHGEPRFALHFNPVDVRTIARALVKAGRPVSGYTVEALFIELSEIGEPAWANELSFDSENDTFCVYSNSRPALASLARRMQKRLEDPAAMKRLVRAAGRGMLE